MADALEKAVDRAADARLRDQIFQDGIAEGRKLERERCAKIAEAADRDRFALSTFQGVEIAARIREAAPRAE